jgi:hypothetical protein
MERPWRSRMLPSTRGACPGIDREDDLEAKLACERAGAVATGASLRS